MAVTSDFDLRVVDKAYGPHADLYVDVLRVSYMASDEEIQSAFFDRRSELFTILSKLTFDENSDNDEIALSQRKFAEKRMDAVVMAFRILQNPESRRRYEKERERRVSGRLAAEVSSISKSLSQDINPSPRDVQSVNNWSRVAPVDATILKTKQTQKKLSNESKRRTGIDSESKPMYPEERRSNDSQGREFRSSSETPCIESSEQSTIESSDKDQVEDRSDKETSNSPETRKIRKRRRKKPEGVIERINELSIVRTIVDEVHGAYVDTLTAFDQVFNAFTLQEEDIHAVCGKIQNAKKLISIPQA
jgi:hypothetical protein